MKRQSRNLLAAGVVFLLITGACAPPLTPSPTPSPLNVVSAFQAAYNQKDIEKAIALLTDDITYRFGGDSSNDKKTTRNLLEFQFAVNSQWTKNDCQLDSTVAGRLKCKTTFADDCPPPKEYRVDMTFQVSDGKLSTIIGLVNQDDAAISNSGANQREAWAKTNLPAEWAKSSDQGNWWFTNTDQQPTGKLSATQMGQVIDHICTAYSQATK